MSYGIIRVRNLSAGDIGNTEIHNARMYQEKNMKIPDNINPDKQELGINIYQNFENGEETDKPLQKLIEDKFKNLGIKPRKNSVYAIEYVLALSPDCIDVYKEKYSATGMLNNLSKFIQSKHGSNNIVSTAYHFDESNPHAHIIVTPIIEKTKKWKNRHGSGEKKVYALSARDFTGGKQKLRQLQQDFFEFVKGFGNRIGKVFYRGTLAEHQKYKYVQQTDHQIGELRQKLATLKDDVDKTNIKEQINEIKQNFDVKIKEYDNKIEKIKKYRKKDNRWKHGNNYFHDDEPKKDKGMEL